MYSTDENIISRTVKSPICYRCHGHAALEDSVIIHGERHSRRVSTITPTPYRRPGAVDEWKLVLQVSAIDGKIVHTLNRSLIKPGKRIEIIKISLDLFNDKHLLVLNQY